MATYNEKTMLHTYKGADPVITYDHMSENSGRTGRENKTKNINLTRFVLEELFLVTMGIVCLYLYL